MWRISPDNGLSVWQTHLQMVEHMKSFPLFSCEVNPGSLDSISGLAHPARTCPGLNFYPEGKHKQTISQPMTQHFLKFHSPTHRKFVIAPALQMGSSEGQWGYHHLLHQTDPGGAQISPWQPNCPQRHQGERSSDLVSPFMEWSGPGCMKQDRNLCSHWKYWGFILCVL